MVEIGIASLILGSVFDTKLSTYTVLIFMHKFIIRTSSGQA